MSVERDLRVRHEILKQCLGGGRTCLGQLIDLQARRAIGGARFGKRLDRGTDDVEFGRRPPDQQLLRPGIDGQLGVGDQRLKRGQDLAGIGQKNGKSLESRLLFGPGGGVDLLQGRLDRLVLFRPGEGH